MDTNIMKLVEDNEDDTMHSGEDVEAFSTSFSIDIEGDSNRLQTPDSDGVSPHGNNSPSQKFSQWQNSTGRMKQEEANSLQPQEQYSSELESKKHGFVCESKFQQLGCSQETTNQLKHQSEYDPRQSSQNVGIQVSKQIAVNSREHDRTQFSASEPNNSFSIVMLVKAVVPQLDKDKRMQINTMYDKLRRNEIDRDWFLSIMKNIVGDMMFLQALDQVTMQQSKAQAVKVSSSLTTSLDSILPAHTEVLSSIAPTGPGTIVKIDSRKPSVGQKKSTDALAATPIKMQKVSGAFQDQNIEQLNDVAASTGPGTNVKIAAKKPSVRRKKPIDALDTPIPTPSKKQKVSGAFQDQSTEIVNDVTVVSGVTIGEEEKQLLSGPKQESRASEATRRVVQEEERLILHKAPLQKRMAEIRSKHGIEKVSNDVSSFLATTSGSVGPTNAEVLSTSTAIGHGSNVKTASKRTSVRRKKPIDALGTPAPTPSKKQKVSRAFQDQSIEIFNDVTAVSGVNIGEEEEQLLSGPEHESRASEATRRVVQEEEERLILQKAPLQKRIAEIMSKHGIQNVSNDVERCLSLCVEERMSGLISNLIRVSKQRVEIERPRHTTLITSDVWRQILLMNRKVKEDREKKQAEETEKVRKLNEADGNIATDGKRGKAEGRTKNLKEDYKTRAAVANEAAREAVGGDDMQKKWQDMAEKARQKREGGTDTASASSTPGGTRVNQDAENSGTSTSLGVVGGKFGRNPVAMPHKISRTISVKDVIAVLERVPQMSKSTLVYRLYERMRSGADAAKESPQVNCRRVLL